MLLALAALVLAAPAPDLRTHGARSLEGPFPLVFEGDVGAWSERRESVRRRVFVAAGLWPLPPRAPARAAYHGRDERDGFAVESVRFATFPGRYVAGRVFTPHPPGGEAAPAVLALPDHDGSADELCVALARAGLVVLRCDPPPRACGAGFGDADAELGLQSAFGVRAYDALCAFELLARRPDVDARRIGALGGTHALVLCALDERPAAAFATVLDRPGLQHGCACENASHLRVGTGSAELAALVAPRPLALACGDQRADERADGIADELRAIWSLYGAPHRVAAESGDARWPVAFFADALGLAVALPPVERPFAPLAEPEPLPPPSDAKDVAEVRASMDATARDQRAALKPHDPARLAVFRRFVGGALEVLVPSALPARGTVAASASSVEERGFARVERLVLERTEPAAIVGAGPGAFVRGALALPRDFAGTVVVAVSERGAPPAFTSEALARGVAVLAIEPLLAREGAGAFLPVDARHAQSPAFTWGFNPTLFAWRVHDVLTAIGYARDLGGATRVVLAGDGALGRVALWASALAGDVVARTALDWTWSEERAPALDDPAMLPGLAKYGGDPSVAALCAPRPLLLVGASEAPATPAAAYAAAGAPSALAASTSASPRELLDWLTAP